MPFLSHYTSRAGLEGIAESHSLWGTNFLCVNDSSEFLYAWRILIRDAAEEALKQVPDHQKRPDYNLEAEALRLGTVLRDSSSMSDGYGHLYMLFRAGGERGSGAPGNTDSLASIYAAQRLLPSIRPKPP